MNSLPYHEINSHQARTMLDGGGATLIDVRTPDEYGSVRAKNARLIPIEEFAARLDELPQEGDLIFICASGVRSAVACEYALAAGHQPHRLHNLLGGTNEWVQLGLPVNHG